MIAVAAIALGYPMRRHWSSVLRQEMTRSLAQKARMLASRIDADHAHNIDVIASQEGLAAGARATVIDTNRKVIADSESTVAASEDEGKSPEFETALKGSVGVQTRRTNGIRVLYVAVPVSGGAVRLAYPLADAEIASAQADKNLAIGVIVAMLFALLISAVTACCLSRP
jgi:two-component system, OmpR family, phosphate regulon sensor histidine kinase PhoR